MALSCRVVTELNSIDPAAWNALVHDRHPLLSHEFLTALEQFGVVSEATGWHAHHLIVESVGELLGAMPAYQKYNSWGEFVFDHAWANAYEHYGLQYYPKLVNAIPFSPVFGQRLLARRGQEQDVYQTLLTAAINELEAQGLSGLHCLFPTKIEHSWLLEQGLVARHDCQYHWRNNHYPDFEAFLASLSAKKRKNIRQERRKVADSGITFRRLRGDSATAEDWQNFHYFYKLIYQRKWGQPVFPLAFFKHIGQLLAERVLLVLADDASGECIAGALMYSSDTTLYGRHWGTNGYVDGLHFETCYYQGIEFCIEHGLELFEPGAQGAHKLARGFEPTLTASAHWIADSRFRHAIEQFVSDEKNAVEQHISAAQQHSAYKAGV